MHAANEGAGSEHSFGVNIRLPFEQKPNAVIVGNPRVITYKYFFNRKVAFLKQPPPPLPLPPFLRPLPSGMGLRLPVCSSVSVSIASSSVPKPPGKSTTASACLRKATLRLKKYLYVMTRGLPTITAFGFCSKGNRMFSRKECSEPAPSLAACMIPLPHR